MSSAEWLPPSPTPSAPPSVPAGWYADPQGRGQRYWDGTHWTDHLAPLAAPAAKQDNEHPATAGDWVGGILLSGLLPIVGFILGIVWAAKGGKRATVGFVCIGVAVLAFFFWASVFYAGASDPGAYSTV